VTQLTEDEQVKIAKRIGLIQHLPSGVYDGTKKVKEYVHTAVVDNYIVLLDLIGLKQEKVGVGSSSQECVRVYSSACAQGGKDVRSTDAWLEIS